MYLHMYVHTLHIFPHLFLQGIVGGIQDMFGYIECSNKEVQAAFHLSEVMDTNAELTVGDEVEYSPVITKDKVSMSVLTSCTIDTLTNGLATPRLRMILGLLRSR